MSVDTAQQKKKKKYQRSRVWLIRARIMLNIYVIGLKILFLKFKTWIVFYNIFNTYIAMGCIIRQNVVYVHRSI